MTPPRNPAPWDISFLRVGALATAAVTAVAAPVAGLIGGWSSAVGVLAVIRRTRKGQSPFSPDKMHLHHRLLSIGHSHRRAVLVMYFWAALLSFGAVALSITGGRAELLIAIAVLLLVGVIVVLSPRARRAAREARAAELAAQRERSRAEHPTARALRVSDTARAPKPAPRQPADRQVVP